MLPQAKVDVQIADLIPKSRYAEINLTEIISRLNLQNDNKKVVENAWNLALLASKLDSWLGLPAQKDLKAKCDVELKRLRPKTANFF